MAPLDLARYLSLFVAEAGDHLGAFSRELVALEQAARQGEPGAARQAIDSLFRHAHSVKGMSASMQLDAITALAHKAEDLVDVFRQGSGRIDPGAVDLLLATADALGALVEAAARGERREGDPALVERLAQAAQAARSGRAVAP
ncbi:MAG TPA: Hpt domain-containing protein, partial [Anaeromyxobacteraceae bacterium]|nr:Hpt domain-containing protein [Anaeromyxobacteraceae bacterium]